MKRTTIKPLGRALIALLGTAIALAIAYAGVNVFAPNLLAPPSRGKSEVPTQASLPEIQETAPKTAVPKLPLPSADAARSGAPSAKIMHYAWAAHRGLLLANGGPRTTRGSLMEAAGVDLALQREDDNGKLTTALLTAAKATKSGQPFGDGSPCITLMGDGTPAFLAGANAELAKVGPDSVAKVVALFGFSRGEDKFMGRPWWKIAPKLARGSLVAGVLRDGDWNIVLKWASDNGIKNNPDETTWDPDAINWLGTNSYTGDGGADQAYINAAHGKTEKDPTTGNEYPLGVCQERAVTIDGKRTGEKKEVCVNGVTTWTPGDVNIAQKKGGLVSIVSTKEYRSQMPCVMLCVSSWAQKNRAAVEGIVEAASSGADQVRAHKEASRMASEIAAVVFGEQTADYWDKYSAGVVENDKIGLSTALGGSAVSNVNDAADLFGLSPGSANVFAAVYGIFGDILVQQYPKLFRSYPKVDDVVDASFLRNVIAKNKTTAPADSPVFSGGVVRNVISKRSWAIEFAPGSATFAPEAVRALGELANGALVASELAIEIHGHTDNTGDAAGNMSLSQRRAAAVRDWLTKKSSSNFPATRFAIVPHGQSMPVASNATEDGRRRNRRVDIVLGVE